jgi:hypothetical protein
MTRLTFNKFMTPFHFKHFQREDYARGAILDGLVLAHEPGLGKTLAAFVWPALKVGFHAGARGGISINGTCLIVAPGDLHDQYQQEAQQRFKTTPTLLNSQSRFYELSRVNPRTGRRELPPGFYLSSYTQLTGNGVVAFPKLNPLDPSETLSALNLTQAHLVEHFENRAVLYRAEYDLLQMPPHESNRFLDARFRAAWTSRDDEAFHQRLNQAYEILHHFHTRFPYPRFAQLNAEQIHFITAQVARLKHEEYCAGIGETRQGSARVPRAVVGVAPTIVNSKFSLSGSIGATPIDAHGTRALPELKTHIKCIYSPSLADLCQDVFDVVVADEATKIQGEETIIGTGTRQLNPRFRLVMTATPMKNRLPSIFRLAWWAAGGSAEAHARFPYPDASEARDEFAREFIISERNLTKEEDTHRRWVKLTPRVCNVHRLWKLFAPLILRRRKKDCGEDIVQKFRHCARVPMGLFQAGVYKYHLEANYTDLKGQPAIGAQLQALRIAAADPSSAALKCKTTVGETPTGTRGTRALPNREHGTWNPEISHRSPYPYIPKLAAALTLIKEIMERGEQVIVFHTFLSSIDLMSERLEEACVPHLVMDGRTSPARRGKFAAQFKRGRIGGLPVMLANSDCMAAGHSFPLCANGIHYSYQWALDLTLQSDDRYYRINSPRDVNSYRLICNGSIDPRMEAQAEEKADAAELVLDGQLIQDYVADMNPAELLRHAAAEMLKAETPKTNIETLKAETLKISDCQPVSLSACQFIDERELIKTWPKLRDELAAAAKRWTTTQLPEPYLNSKLRYENIEILTC